MTASLEPESAATGDMRRRRKRSGKLVSVSTAKRKSCVWDRREDSSVQMLGQVDQSHRILSEERRGEEKRGGQRRREELLKLVKSKSESLNDGPAETAKTAKTQPRYLASPLSLETPLSARPPSEASYHIVILGDIRDKQRKYTN